MSNARIRRIFKQLSLSITEPTTELEFETPFQLLIAVMLSAQATDKSVNIATKRLFAIAPHAESILNLGQPRLLELIRNIGLAPTKSKNVIKTCTILLEKYNGDIPQTREQLEELPGVGRKTANVILNTVFKQPTIAVDTHVSRLARRLGIASPQDSLLTVENKLVKAVPKPYLIDAHHLLILHGRYVCKAQKPSCDTCSIETDCPSSTLKNA